MNDPEKNNILDQEIFYDPAKLTPPIRQKYKPLKPPSRTHKILHQYRDLYFQKLDVLERIRILEQEIKAIEKYKIELEYIFQLNVIDQFKRGLTYQILDLKFKKHQKEEHIAELLYCDISTVKRRIREYARKGDEFLISNSNNNNSETMTKQ